MDQALKWTIWTKSDEDLQIGLIKSSKDILIIEEFETSIEAFIAFKFYKYFLKK